jgi:hypothetical protein
MENYSDLDTSLESDYESSQGSAARSDCDEDENESEPSEFYDEYENAPWNLESQFQSQLDAA